MVGVWQLSDIKILKKQPSVPLTLPEKYFDMKKVQCKEGLDIYKKFLTRMTRISEFLQVAEVSGSRINRIHLL